MPVAQVKAQDTPYGKRYTPHNPLAKDLFSIFEVMHVNEENYRKLEKFLPTEVVKC